MNSPNACLTSPLDSQGIAETTAHLHTFKIGRKQLFGQRGVTDTGVKALAEGCSQLHTVALCETLVTEAGVRELAERCSQLRHIDLTRTYMTDTGARALASHCSQLRSIVLYGYEVTAAGVQALAESCLHLCDVSLFNTRVSDEGICALAERCPQLQELDLRYTFVTNRGVRVVAERCTQLHTLFLIGTGVTDAIMLTLAEYCPNLRRMRLSDNMMFKLPDGLQITEDAQVLLQFFREAHNTRSCPVLEVKVPILGLGQFGKSHLARRLAPRDSTERQSPYLRDAKSTHAFEQRTATTTFIRKGVKHDCLLRLFDFGGQPEMHGTHRFFLADRRNVYVVLISKRLSRAVNRLDYWLRMVKHHGGGAPTVVVVSHNDFEPAATERVLNPPAIDKALGVLNAYDISQEHGMPVWVVQGYSNVTGEGLDRVWDAIHAAVVSLDAVFNDSFPQNFFNVHAWATGHPENGLKDRPPFERYLTVRDFKSVCAAAGQTDEGQQLLWLTLLRDLGLLHYVGDRPEVNRDPANELKQFIFHPEWLKQPVYNVVRHQDAYECAGIMSYASICRAFGAGVPDEADQRRIVALMEAYELIFRVSGGKPEEADYLIVDCVTNRPEGMVRANWPSSPQKRLRWEFQFLPDYLLSQLLGRWFSQVPSGTSYFRDDVVFADRVVKSCRIRLRACIHEHAIIIEFDGEAKIWERMLTRLEAEVESILDPERLRRLDDGRLWKTVDSENAPVVELESAEEQTLTALAEAICKIHGLDSDLKAGDLFRLALEAKFKDSLNMTPAPKLAYRACWVFLFSCCVSENMPFDQAAPIGAEIAQMEKVVSWLTRHHEIKTIILAGQKWKTLNKAETLRGNYRNALRKQLRGSPIQEVGDLRRHTVRPEYRRNDDC
ncbi:MAG: hypothetical protein K8U57_28455 [Planctomycetes bacterium]|nr:hypothetical protein [Planctomycetota bacterium]